MVGRLRQMVADTPPGRVRHIDLVRAVAIVAVVLGHWLAAVVIEADGVLTSMNALEVLDWAHPVTWLFQVMPLFFVVGGYANAASLRSHHRRGASSTTWLLDRSDRLVRPVSVLLAVVGGGGLLAAVAGADTRQLGIMAHGALLPLWFLVAYLAVVALTPVMYRLHRRFGLVVPAALVVLMVAGDVLRIGLGLEGAAAGNVLFMWLAVHQAGFAWQDGRLPAAPRVAVPLLAGGLVALVVATVWGPYPVSMINVPGAQVHNVSPPTLALLALATAQLGLALLLKGPGERWMRRDRPWAAVIAINTVTFSMFLWHMPALVLTAYLAHLAGWLPMPAVDSPRWLAWQVPWLLVLAAVLTGILMLVARLERPGDPLTGMAGRLGSALARLSRLSHGGGPRDGARVRGVLTVLAAAGAIGAMLAIAEASPTDRGMVPLPTLALLAWAVAATVLWLLRLVDAQASRTARDDS